MENMVKFRIGFPKVSIFVSWKQYTQVSMEVSISFTWQIGALLGMKREVQRDVPMPRGFSPEESITNGHFNVTERDNGGRS